MRFASLSTVQKYLQRTIADATEGVMFLERTNRLLAGLGNPQNALKVLHVAGTSGKGSTVKIAASLLESHGLTVGMTVSPHLYNVTERVQINGISITEEDFCRSLERVAVVADEMEQEAIGTPSHFEITAALAFLVFADHGVDYAVIETGLGGRWDATNCITRPDKVGLITHIGFDHMHILGETLPEIAGEKAGIIQEGNHIFVTEQGEEILNVLRSAAHKKDATCHIVSTPENITYDESGTAGMISDVQYSTSLIGEHQAANVALALTAVQYIAKRDGVKWDRYAARDALMKIQIPCRFSISQYRDKTVVCDGAHNPQKVQALIKTFANVFPEKNAHIIFAAKHKKDTNSMLESLSILTDRITFPKISVDEQDFSITMHDPVELAQKAQSHGFTSAKEASSISHALKKIPNDVEIVLVCGSLYLASQAYLLCGGSDV